MNNLFAKARAWLPAQLKLAAAVSVTYARGANSINLTPIVGRTVFASNMDGGARIEFGERDYLIFASDMASLGVPAEGDRITEVIDGLTSVFEVVPPATGEPAWRWSDPGHTTYRIHMKRAA